MSTITYSSCPVCNGNDLQDQFISTDFFLSQEKFPIIKCNSCSFILTQNAPDQEASGKYYESDDYISHSDNNSGLVFKLYHWARGVMLNLKLKIVQKHSVVAGKLLDIGSGTGYFLHQAKSFGWEVEGIEHNQKTREQSIQSFQCKVEPVGYLNEIQKEEFDAVTMWHVLEHVHELNEYIKQIHSILKPGGVFVVAVPNPASKDQDIYKEHWAAWDVPRHIWHFTPKSMTTLMAKHGFNIVNTKRMPFDPFYISLMSEKYRGGGKIKGFINGTISFISCLFNKEKCSSLVYVIKKS